MHAARVPASSVLPPPITADAAGAAGLVGGPGRIVRDRLAGSRGFCLAGHHVEGEQVRERRGDLVRHAHAVLRGGRQGAGDCAGAEQQLVLNGRGVALALRQREPVQGAASAGERVGDPR
jgi:hypothetical protein